MKYVIAKVKEATAGAAHAVPPGSKFLTESESHLQTKVSIVVSAVVPEGHAASHTNGIIET